MDHSPITGVYKIINLINNKVYIGQSINIFSRWYAEKSGWGGSSHLLNAFNKYGINNFKFEIVKQCPIEDLDDIESFFIIAYCSFDSRFGYNKTLGGNRGSFTKETIEKMSFSQKKRFSSLEQRILTGELTKKGMRNPEVINKMKSNRKGWYDRYSEEEKKSYEKKQHFAQSGDKHWTKKKNCSDTTRQLLSLSHRGQKPAIDRGWPTKIIENDIVFTNYKDIQIFLQNEGFNLSGSSVRARIYKATKTGRLTFGYHWIKIPPTILFT